MSIGFWQLIILLVLFGIPLVAVFLERSNKTITRAPFTLWFIAAFFGVPGAIGILQEVLGNTGAIVGLIGLLIFLFVYQRALVQRLRNIGHGKGLAYLAALPVFNLIIGIYSCLRKGAGIVFYENKESGDDVNLSAFLVFLAALLFFGIGVVQFFATLAGLKDWLGIPVFFVFFIAIFIAYMPLIGTIAGFWGAVEVWDWSYWKAGALFFGGHAVIIAAYAAAKMIDGYKSRQESRRIHESPFFASEEPPAGAQSEKGEGPSS